MIDARIKNNILSAQICVKNQKKVAVDFYRSLRFKIAHADNGTSKGISSDQAEAVKIQASIVASNK